MIPSLNLLCRELLSNVRMLTLPCSVYNEMVIRIVSFLLAYYIYFIIFIILNSLSQLHFYDKFYLTMKKNFKILYLGC